MNVSAKQYWALFARHIQPQKWRFALLMGLMLARIGLQIANPQVVRSFIDGALAGQSMDALIIPALVFLAIALVQQVVAVAATYTGENVAWTAANALRGELSWHALNLDMSFHNNHTPGELIERIDGDVTEMANFFSLFIITIVGNGLLLVGILVALFVEDWRFGLAFTVFAIVAIYVMQRLRNLAVPEQKERREAEASLFGFIEEQLNGTEDVRASGAVGYSLRELQRLQGNIFRASRAAHVKNWIIGALVMGGIMTVASLMVFGGGYALFALGTVTVGTIYLFISYVQQIEEPIWALTRQVQSFQTISACVERLTELRAVQPKVIDGTSNGIVPGPLALDFQNVTFGYNGDEPVLRDVNFTLEPGKVLGLLGRTGSGKTTLTRLVFRLYDPKDGCITLNGTDLRGMQSAALRQHVGMVTQDVQLFQASIRDNLTFFDHSITDEQITAAIDALELTDWFRALPKGLDTLLETGGHSLSAGEAQLLAFMRIFLRKPGLVILDEASSRLDPATEARIERAIDRLLQNRTAIIVAHRLHTVHRADEVMILEDGQVSEHGPRVQLASDPSSRFYSLLQTGLEEVLV